MKKVFNQGLSNFSVWGTNHTFYTHFHESKENELIKLFGSFFQSTWYDLKMRSEIYKEKILWWAKFGIQTIIWRPVLDERLKSNFIDHY